ncbi:MAG: L-aspartate oxidase [Holophagaceae bacterium]|nr:L-aspartate oxidase [Holophagaceae bacterium]
MNSCDVLVIGAGAAGCVAALRAAELGANVIIVSKDDFSESNTAQAQGGIIGLSQSGDSPELLARDLEVAGAGLCRSEAVAMLASEGPLLTRDFLWKQIDVPFELEPSSGQPMTTAEAAHSSRRIYHVKDATGMAIQTALSAKVAGHPNIRVLEKTCLVDLITTPHHATNPRAVYDPIKVLGAYLLEPTGDVAMVVAKRTILATGGLGYIYLHTSNPGGATGDGLAAAYRANVRIVNCEYMQFHPTTLYVQGRPRKLLTEALRGEGAFLLNAERKRFMADFEPEEMELAPRDRVCRAIFDEMANSAKACVYLDLSPLVAKMDLAERFPTVFMACLSEGIDPRHELVPVVPAAHYFCGGVWVDLEGRTSMDGLYAVGEVACTGVHGANRLASSSLLEGMLWGYRAASAVSEDCKKYALPDITSIRPWQPVLEPVEPDPLLIEQDWVSIRSTMWNYAGIVRTKDRLERAREDIGYLYHRIEAFYRRAPVSKQLLELRNGIICARLVLKAALQNPESRGCHFRID